MRLISSILPWLAGVFAFFAGFFTWARRDAKRDTLSEVEKKDMQHADEIANRLADSRSDDDRLHSYQNAGYRD